MEYGIIDLHRFSDSNSFNNLKRYFYLYDKLYAYHYGRLKRIIDSNKTKETTKLLDEIDLLIDQGYIDKMNVVELMKMPIFSTEEYIQLSDMQKVINKRHFKEHRVSPIRFLEGLKDQEDPNITITYAYEGLKDLITFEEAPPHLHLPSIWERMFALLAMYQYDINLMPTSHDSFTYNLPIDKSDIIRLLISKIPVPDDSIPLVDIIQYRNDDSNKLRLLRLKSWMRKFSKENYNLNEAEEEIETLIMEYQNELKLAGMKYTNAKVEFLIKAVPAALENLVKLNFSKIVDPIFELKNEKVSLMQAENSAKGNELAYLITSNKKNNKGRKK